MDMYKMIEAKKDDILRIAAKHGALNVRVIGSTARREASSESDIDLLVELELGRTLLDHAALILELQEFLGRKVDVASDRGLRARVRDRVLEEAVPL